MKKIVRSVSAFIMCGVILCVCAFPAFAENTAYELDKLHMSIAVPNDMLTITRESKKTDSYFSKFGLDHKETMDEFKEGNIYLRATKDDSSLTLNVAMTIDDNSEELGSYSKADDQKLTEIREELLENKDYKSASVVEYNGIKYIYLTMSTKSDNKIVQSHQYHTVVNGQNINITLSAAPGKKFTADNKALFTDMMEQTSIIEVSFVSENMGFIVYGGATLIGIIIVVLVLILLLRYFRNPERRHKHLVHELAHEHKITETSKIPRSGFKHERVPQKAVREEIAGSAALEARRARVVSEPVADAGLESDEAEFEPLNEAELDAVFEPETAHEAQPVAEPGIGELIAEPDVEESLDEAVDRAVGYGEASVENNGEAVGLDSFEDDTEEIEEFEPVEPVKPLQPLNTERIDRVALEEALEAQKQSEIPDTAEVVEAEDEGYFDIAPEDEQFYSYDESNSSVSDYRRPKYAYDEDNYDEESSQTFSENARKGLAAVGRVLKIVGVALLKVLAAIWTFIVFAAVHCKYFCINMYRMIKRKRAMKKRRKAEEERRRKESERRRIERDAERNRRMENARRGENDLVKVHSSGERTVRRNPGHITVEVKRPPKRR